MAKQGPQRALIVLGACIVVALLLPRAAAAPAAAQEDNPLTCQCTDVDPRTEFILPAEYTCWQQYKFGSCGQGFMKQTIIEIPEGYCQITCGECTCCPTLLNATISAGATEFAWAMELLAASNRTERLDQPGLMVTLLAPDNNAMQALYTRLGGKDRIASDPGVQGSLSLILQLHILPPLNATRAVWTAPFFQPGVKLDTLAGPETLTIVPASEGTGGIKIQAAASSAQITQADVYACKGFVNVLNRYLLPSAGIGQ